MRLGQYKRHILAALTACALLLSSCGSGAASVGNTRRMQELGSAFVEQLDSSVIRYREEPRQLSELEAVVVTGDKTYHISRLYDFYGDYRVGQSTELLVVFHTKSFVVGKIVFEGSAGYYFRYEYDKFDENAINVTSQFIDKMEIAEDSKVGKVEVTLKREKMADIVMTFRSIADEEEPSA